MKSLTKDIEQFKLNEKASDEKCKRQFREKKKSVNKLVHKVDSLNKQVALLEHDY